MECAAKGRVATPCSPPPPTRRCARCEAVAYCSLPHQISHWNDHKEECPRFEKQMSRIEALDDFPFTFSIGNTLLGFCKETACSFLMSKGIHQIGLWKSECSCGPHVASSGDSWINVDWNLPRALCPCAEPRNPILTCLKSWKDYYLWRHLPFHSPVALLLHWPLTIYHCLQLAGTRSLTMEGGDKLCIHYLGPEREVFQLAVFGELHALFPGVQLHMDLIGPTVPKSRDGERISLFNYARCSEEGCPCKSTLDGRGLGGISSSITIQLRNGFYHDRHRDLEVSSPNLIIAPNAGVAAYSSWLPTVDLIERIGAPAIFTDFCEEAAHLAARCINSVTGRPVGFPIQVNPFRQPMVVENSALRLPCYSNCFLFGM